MTRPRAEPVLLGLLLALLTVHAVCTVLDFAAVVRFPYARDYGEGIVWQQTVLIPGPRMYSPSQALPFIVFHYPPVYYLLVRAAASVVGDMLAAGRSVSAGSSVLIAVLVGCLVQTASRQRQIGASVIGGLLVLCLHAVHDWGPLMRVDMAAVALSLAGVLVAARSDGSGRGITVALLLCLASVYCKQTQLPAGIAVFGVSVLRRPRAALGAAAVALVIGLAVLALMQHLTAGGFLLNIVGYNVNRVDLLNAVLAVYLESGSVFFAVVMVLAALRFLPGLAPAVLRRADRATATRAMLMLYFLLATPLLLAVVKSGGTYNYFLDWLCVGCALAGVLLGDLAGSGRQTILVTCVLIAGALFLPWRDVPDRFAQDVLDRNAALVERIRAATLPVASDNMTLLMLAGKPVIFEPAIATELALVGRWDETPLVDMIRAGGFAFMITADNDPQTHMRRTPAVDAAMRATYPVVQEVGPLFVHTRK